MLERLKVHLKQMKPLDIFIIIVLFVASFIPHVIYAYQLDQLEQDGVAIMAEITIDGEEVYSVELSEETPHEEFTLYPADGQYNIIEVDGTRIRNREDNSPDQIGVRRGWISQPGETAVVLPHRLIIEVKAVDKDGHELNPNELNEDQGEGEENIEDQEDVVIPM
ncbi:MAG TPA: NusG domain II-containing protein [Alloiococcus sp.]|nr:NusG domain II-containing protein [Alloiococcus sp.]